MLKRPSFVLVTVDCLRPDHLGCYGYDHPISPNIDQLAEQGVRFEQAITNGGWTQPGIVSLLTSSYGLMYEGCRKPLSPNRPSLPEALSHLGYATAGFTANPQVGKAYGYHRGFRVFEELEPHRRPPLWCKTRGHARLLRSPLTHRLLGLLGMSALPPVATCNAETITESLCRWLETRKGPFFAWIHYMDAHFPYVVDRNLHFPQEMANAWRKLRALYDSAKHGHTKHPGRQILELVKADYDQAIAYVDEHVGVILDQLERLRLADDTAVIITADHGEAFFEHGLWGHNRLYDEVVRVPLIVRTPGVSSGGTISHQVSHLDVAPTVMDIADVPCDPRMLGHGLKSVLSGGSYYTRGHVICEMIMKNTYHIAIRTEMHKYIYCQARPDACELYDLTIDPGERINLAKESPGLVAEFQSLVARHLEAVQGTRDETELGDPVLSEDVVQRLRALGYLE